MSGLVGALVAGKPLKDAIIVAHWIGQIRCVVSQVLFFFSKETSG